VLYTCPDRWRIIGARVSPDGRYLAVTETPIRESDSHLNNRLRLVNLATGQTGDLWGGVDRDLRTVGWSPDSRGLVFSGMDLSGPELKRSLEQVWYLVDPASARLQTLPSPAPGEDLDICLYPWSPDSRHLLACDSLHTARLFTVDTQTGQGHMIAVIPGAKFSVGTGCAWSPDGRRVAFGVSREVGSRTDEFQIFVVPSSGGEPVAVTKPSFLVRAGVSWTPDGHHLFWSQGGAIMVMRVAD
jgi:Tol biopolymer transport system component